MTTPDPNVMTLRELEYELHRTVQEQCNYVVLPVQVLEKLLLAVNKDFYEGETK